jgi:hypothetical protein
MGVFPKPGAAEVIRGLASQETVKESPIPRYDMTPDEAKLMCSEFLASREARPVTQFGCYIIPHDETYSNLGRFVEGTVFGETFNNSPEVMEQEYGAYENASTFYLVVDHDNSLPVGVMRVIENSDAGLKTLNDIEREDTLNIKKREVEAAYSIDPDRCIDLATLAVLPEYRGSNANYIPSMLTYRTLYLNVLSNPNYDHVVAIIDERAERNLQNLKFPFRRIFDSEGFSYLDSPKSYALYAPNDAFYPQVNFWAQRYQQEGQASGDERRLWKASIIDSLINDGIYDEMLGYTKPARTV